MSLKRFAAITPLRWVLYRLARWRVREKLAAIGPYLNKGDRVLDVGAGNCVLCQQLRHQGYEVLPLDLENLSFIDGIAPTVYDGKTIPFPAKSFEVALLITVLHHTSDPDAVLAEVSRVARRIIVVEEIYQNLLEKYYTYAIDSLFNWEWFGHPRSNRTDAGWRTAFERLNLTVSAAAYSRSMVIMRRVIYALDCGNIECGKSATYVCQVGEVS
ncbi:MAG TPA: class I SAM-dependent methyltransferase [Pirellulales bacterium]|nr:class I SAM-dependent methyltransferase [Pirellulales bacterium]